MIKATLVLEGGAFRGVFTSGVLDVLLEKNINIETTIGVSAGALTGCGYVANQIGFSKEVNLGYRHDPNYVGIRAIINEKSVIDFSYLFNTISVNKVSFDFNSFYNSKKQFIAVATNCLTGKADYFSKEAYGKDILKAVQASSSIPLACPMTMINDIPYFDGGISHPTPIDYAFQLGYDKVVVVLTRCLDYQSKINNKIKKLCEIKYNKYPNFIKAFNNINETYNNNRKLVNQCLNDKKIFVIGPKENIHIKGLEPNVDKLTRFYNYGKKICLDSLSELEKYLKN